MIVGLRRIVLALIVVWLGAAIAPSLASAEVERAAQRGSKAKRSKAQRAKARAKAQRAKPRAKAKPPRAPDDDAPADAPAAAEPAPSLLPAAATPATIVEPRPQPEPPVTPDVAASAPSAPGADDGITQDLVATLQDGTPLYRRQTTVARRTGAIRIDGLPDEPAWQASRANRMDWQQRPQENTKATGETVFRLLYDDEAFYIAADMMDPNPAAIVDLLYRPLGFRRAEQSDWIIAILAPSEDRSVGYAFAINPAGVKLDYRMTRTGAPDETYNGIWDAAIVRTATGWHAEYRIPYSQMRVSDGDEPKWGFQLYRKWGRNHERDYWSPYPTTYKQEVAAFGDIHIDGAIDAGVSLEVMPYVVGGGRLESIPATNQLTASTEPEYGVGADIKAQLGASLKLTASVNPDFGQIEADPAEVNLTDRETFFTERRPLFIEDADLFNFTLGEANENLFYSRRIGARPHFSQRAGAAFVDEPDATTIYGAGKLSGSIGGVKIGAMSALAAEERSRSQLALGERQEAVIEPMTSYNAVQLARSFRGGASELRLVGTGVRRFLDDTGIDRLHENAYAGALSYLHNFANNHWQITGLAGGSHVDGDPAALLGTQRASQRYFQRPDASHVELDPMRTKLEGYMFGARAAKIAGTWRGGVSVDGRSPGFEANDVGFLLDADYVASSAHVAYESLSKTGPKKSFLGELTATTITDFAPEVLRHVGMFETETRLRNDWLLGGALIYTRQVLDTKLLRGGPAVAGIDSGEAKFYVETDSKRAGSLRLDTVASAKPESGSWRAAAALGLTWDILSNLELNLTPTYIVNREDAQYVGAAADAMGVPHYVLGRIEQQTLLARMRLNYTITPRLSLQAYAEPFLSAGNFVNFKEATNVSAASYDDRFTRFAAGQVTETGGQVQIDRDGDGAADFAVRRPDFQVGSLLTNLVFRWEFRPASALFLIWSQSREGSESDGVVDRGDFSSVFTSHSAHVVLVKLTVWGNL